MALVAAADFDRIKASAQRFASGFTTGQKVMTALAVVAVVAGGFVFMQIAGKPSYGVLFSNLQATDAAQITTKLQAANVPYQLTDGGATILVPQNDVYQERINMASAGLPTNGNVGLSLLDKEGITTSQQTQQADYQQAIQGELASTIEAIQGVQSATVNVALPQTSTFAASNQSPTGASVLVTMDSGQTLQDGQVQAIVHLVASSVPGLSADDVTVSDSSGNLLAGPGVNNGLGQQSQTEAEYDSGVQSKISAFLAPILGPDNADIQVSSQFNFNQTSTSTTGLQLGPNGVPITAVTSTSTSVETLNNGSTAGGGLGTTLTTTTPGSSFTTSQSQSSVATGQTQTTTVVAPGAIEAQSIAVVVNKNSLPAGTSIAALQSEVAGAVGVNTARGDRLVMTALPFSTTQAQAAAKQAAAAAAAKKQQEMLSLIRGGVVGLVIAAALFLLWRSARKTRAERPPLSLGPPVALPFDTMAAMPPMDETTEVPAIQVGRMSEKPKVELASDMANFIDSQPDEVAILLRSWMQDRKPTPRPAGVGSGSAERPAS